NFPFIKKRSIFYKKTRHILFVSYNRFNSSHIYFIIQIVNYGISNKMLCYNTFKSIVVKIYKFNFKFINIIKIFSFYTCTILIKIKKKEISISFPYWQI